MGGNWPLVGRNSELHRLERLLASPARGLVLAGAAGVGKTRLALEFLGLARRAGAETLRVTATRAAAALPLGAFAPLLPAAEHGRSIAVGVDSRIDLLRRSADALVQSAAGKRLVLLVDDAHLLDGTSAALIHQMVATGAAFVVVTIRSGEPAPDPVTALWKDEAVERLEMGGLRADAIEELLLTVLGGPVDRGAVSRLSLACQGNVLFLRELVLGGLEDGTLRDDLGIWRLVGRLSPSSRLVEIVEARLEGLADAERDLLEVVAFGEPIGAAELGAVSHPPLAEDLERRGLLFSRTDGRRLRISMGHSLYGQVLRERTPVIRTRQIARSLADAVEAVGARRREDVLRVGTWRLEGGSAGPELMLKAAVIARWRYDFRLAERLARGALQAGAGFEAALLAAQLASLQGRASEAETQLASLKSQATDDRQRALVVTSRLENFVFFAGQMAPDAGLKMAEEAEAAMHDPAWRDEVAAWRIGLVIAAQGPRAGVEAAKPLLPRVSGRALAHIGVYGSFALGRTGRLGEARDLADRAHAAHLALTEPLNWFPWIHVIFGADSLAHAGRLNEAHAIATTHHQQSVAERSFEMQAWFAWELSKNVPDRGYPRTAGVHCREAAALFREAGRPQFEGFVLGYLALALALSGQPDEARKALVSLDALELPPAFYLPADVLQARAWTAVAEGDLPRARTLLEEAATVGEDIGDFVGEAAALHGLARLGAAKQAAPRLKMLAASIEGVLAPARAAHATALVANDAADLEAVSLAFEDMGARLLAAEAAADAAVAWRRQGEPRRATHAEHRAGSIASACENPVTPALQAVKSRAQLTRAEREVALLAASGRSSREIADRLFVSKRTVENQLQHVYQKLGVSRRSDLADALSDLADTTPPA